MDDYHRRLKFYFFLLTTVLFLNSCGISKSLHDKPDISIYNATVPERVAISDSVFIAGNNFLTKNQHGLWELYVEGDPLERGMVTGLLTRELMQRQEAIFLGKVEQIVPSKSKQAFLRKFLAWFNRKMYQHVEEEFKAEIYGLSQFSSDTYDYIAPPYLRVLYLHGAHDIGHALQDLALVGCSSFAVWGENTSDGKLLIGRNFDFYAGDDFAEEKIVAFVNPSEGYKFMSVTWGGMIGVVSGMNMQGLTVTINAGKSKVPLVAKTPISLVTREILQYASTIEEAIAIAKGQEVFVSESIFIGSAKDGRAALIELSPSNFGVYQVANSSELICSNHFQSEAFVDDRRNKKQIEESHSQYRFERMEELIGKKKVLDPKAAVAILRNKDGLGDVPIGFGNEKALNQLLAHHGIVFKPNELKVWVSTNPYQLGEFVAYDLNEVFRRRENNPAFGSVSATSLTIDQDSFVSTDSFRHYEAYRILEREVEAAIEDKENVIASKLAQLQRLNPNYWKAHYLAAKYYLQNHNKEAALAAFEKASALEITTVPDRKMVEKYIKKLRRKRKP
jgi:hypothetical protein